MQMIVTLLFVIFALESFSKACVHDMMEMKTISGSQDYIFHPSNPDFPKNRNLKASAVTYNNIRIHLHYDEPNMKELTSAQSTFLRDRILPDTVKFWHKALKVIPVNGNLFAERFCDAVFTKTTKPVCHMIIDNQKCQDILIPQSHFKSKRYCSSCTPGTDCSDGSCKTTVSGVGIPNADFVLYVQALSSSHCQGSVLAYANSCQRDQYDRPTFGMVNFCPNKLNPNEYKKQLHTALHEVSHALGFTSHMFPYMRNPDGSPRTPRDQRTNEPLVIKNVTCPNNQQRSDLPIPSTSTVKVFTERGRQVAKIVTPNVLRFVRDHFGCDSLNGAELESQDKGCFGSHWEERIFESEFMSPVQSHSNRVSGLTLAYFEDSGWYRANHDVAEPIYWGAKRGCGFAMEKCIQMGGKKSLEIDHFCTAVSESGCSVDASSIAVCTYQESAGVSIPKNYQYFTNPKTGGHVFNDYCPILSGVATGDCSNSANLFSPPGTKINILGESYCPTCKCAKSSLQSSAANGWRLKNRNSGCYKMTCSNGVVTIKVPSATKPGSMETATCSQKGQEVQVNGFSGSLFCPDPSVICGNAKCTSKCKKNSICNSSGKCMCLSGYIPDSTGGGCKSACPNSCSRRGFCDTTTKKCKCNKGFTGNSCENAVEMNAFGATSSSTQLHVENSLRFVVLCTLFMKFLAV